MNIMEKRILLVDGMALLFRGYFATAYSGNFMKTDKGVPTNGVFQFLRYFLDGIEEFNPTHVICCWDMGSKTFRTELFDEYKSNRSAPPEELVPQFDMVKEVVDGFDIPNIGLVSFEADDIIGSLAKQYAEEAKVIIQTGDFDMLQLVDKNVDVAIMKKGIGNYDVFNEQNFYDKKGLFPYQIVEFKAFTGDSADNYPGVKGIGEKTATTLMQKYNNIDEILLSLNELTPGVRNKIEENLEMFYLSKQLAEIKCDINIDLNLETAKLEIDKDKVTDTLNNLGVSLRSVSNYL